MREFQVKVLFYFTLCFTIKCTCVNVSCWQDYTHCLNMSSVWLSASSGLSLKNMKNP